MGLAEVKASEEARNEERRRLEKENAELRAELGRLQDWSDKVHEMNLCWQCQREFEKACE